MLDLDIIKNEIKNFEDELIKIRRHIHQNPELSMTEYNTSEFIIKKLKSFGITDIERVGATGVTALIKGNSNRCLAIRADMDALPFQENTPVAYSSKNDGIAHACGHDIHTTCLLGCAYILNKYKNNFDGTVKLLFQPGEEKGVGAKSMIENGALNNPVPEAIFGLHCWPDVKAGSIFHRSGKMSASSDTFKIIIEGSQGHAAHPYKAVDPIMIAGNIICGVQNIISREVSPLESGVITLSAINGGNAANVIPKTVEIIGSIRALSPEIRTFLHQRLTEIAEGTAKTFRGSAVVEIYKGTPVVINDDKISALIQNTCENILGKENVIYNPYPSMGSEDFAYYLEQIPGAMYRLGCGFENEKNYPLHSNSFNPNEDSIVIGVLTLVAIADNFFKD
ncbi:M20 metallopeptidase family protein [Fusobacterium varium]|uniref:M20 metallopeptidase family protein n=1 Tax=Fusobacterium varium TaxID=856 RepID=UPI001F4610E6|nr:M20 family metallopeptidase [Fusobacterium varium]MCF2672687.1 amidohydrolase [Fusobacterium varium]